MNNPVEQALELLESVLCDPEGKASVAGSAEDRELVNHALTILRSIVNTGVMFRRFPVLLAPRLALFGDGPPEPVDQNVLTQLDRFLRSHFPHIKYLVGPGEPFVTGALPPKIEPDETFEQMLQRE